MPQTRIGISGWHCPPWRGAFYPKTLTQKNELHHASRQVNSIEINGTFYSLQRPSSFQLWHDQTPANFVFSVKGPRFITHIRRLRDVDEPLANFFASGVLTLNEKLGPFLWQFPPNFKFDLDRFADFLPKLPQDTDAAALAKHHGDRMKEIYPKGYTPKSIERWAARIKSWRKGREPRDAEKIAGLKPPPRKSRDVFAYFDTDKKIYAPDNARLLTKLLSQPR